MIRKIFFNAFLSIVLTSTGFAQLTEAERIEKQYPDERGVYLYRNTVMKITTDGGQINVYKDINEMVYALASTSWLRERSVYYTDFEEITNIKAQTILPGKTKEQVIEVTDIQTKDVTVSGIFFGDSKKKSISYPAVQKGAKLSFSYRENILDPHFLGSHSFKTYIPVEKSSFQVRVPDNVKITYKLFGETDDIEFTKTQKNGMTVYTWVGRNLNKEQYQSNAPSTSFYTPHVIVYINEAEIDGKNVTVLNDVADLYKWYRTLTKGLNDEADFTELKKIVKDVTKGKVDETEKIKAIYQWVQNNIKYVAFEDGLGGFRPREADDICTKKYGDCKDMSNLIHSMLGLAGIESHLTWIGTRSKPYSYEELPTPLVDNHMIASVDIDGKTMFLDGTGSYIPFGMPTSMIQGKEAMIGINDKEYKIIKVPVVPKERNLESETIVLNLDGPNVSGRGKVELTGYKKSDFDYDHWGTSNSEKKNFWNDYLQLGNNKFTVDTVSYSGLYDQNANANINYEFSLPGFAKKVGEKIYINLNLKKDYGASLIDIEKRKRRIKNKYNYITSREIILKIPEGYEAKCVGNDVDFKYDKFGFNMMYEMGPDYIKLKKNFYLNFLLLDKDHFKKWNEMVNTLNDAYRYTIVLNKKKN